MADFIFVLHAFQKKSKSGIVTPKQDINLVKCRLKEALAKSELARQIAKLIKKKKLNQKQAAEILGIDQPKISALIRGRLRSFSFRIVFSALASEIVVFVTHEKFNSLRLESAQRYSVRSI